MKKIYLFFTAFALISFGVTAQKKNTKTTTVQANQENIARPKLVVGLVVDQMRWDYLYRYYSRYGQGGFKRLLREGFSAENTLIPYTPAITACGHASIYTGATPAINGIIGNDWYDNRLKRNMYCAEDTTAKTVGSNTTAGVMSPRNMMTTTITDELRLATNFKSKVIGIALKDRGAILPAGHSANAAYWYDGQTGDWITSTYYMQNLPTWLQEYNKKKTADEFFAKNWNTLYPIESYTQSTADNKDYERKTRGEETPTFPHPLKLYIGKSYETIKSTPYGNTITLDLAKLAISSEHLGQGKETDFLAVSCSSTDYVGHQYGPNSVEAEDTFLRLDQDLEAFFNYLDKTVGKGNYLFFLSADHGAAHVPGFMKENRLPGGVYDQGPVIKALNADLEKKFKINQIITTTANGQLYLNRTGIRNANADFEGIKTYIIESLRNNPEVFDVVDLSKLATTTLVEPIKKSLTYGYNSERSGDLYCVLKSNYFSGPKTGTTHGAWAPYDAHIPCVFMGWNVKPGKSNKTHHMTDISATLAAMLHIQMPSGCIGEPITEITNP
jgi:predicted AlkP superfamily pyrophosphatase or phosphodiesterase